jgi:glucose-1-phosphate adenylyltransferase
MFASMNSVERLSDFDAQRYAPGDFFDPGWWSRYAAFSPYKDSSQTRRSFGGKVSAYRYTGINRIYVVTQFLSVSLHQHIRQTYRFDNFNGGFVELLAAQQTMEGGTEWYEGTADAVRKNLRYFDQNDCKYVLILSGDQLYHMDYSKMLETHVNANADVTIAAIPVHRSAAHALGVMRCDDTGRVTGFLEKPKTDEEINMVSTSPAWIDARGIPSQGRDCLASMGLYIFNKELLFDILNKTNYSDFGKEVFPAAIRSRKVQVHLFDDYWEDIGTIRAFYESNLARSVLCGSPCVFQS